MLEEIKKKIVKELLTNVFERIQTEAEKGYVKEDITDILEIKSVKKVGKQFNYPVSNMTATLLAKDVMRGLNYRGFDAIIREPMYPEFDDTLEIDYEVSFVNAILYFYSRYHDESIPEWLKAIVTQFPHARDYYEKSCINSGNRERFLRYDISSQIDKAKDNGLDKLTYKFKQHTNDNPHLINHLRNYLKQRYFDITITNDNNIIHIKINLRKKVL